MLCNYSINNLLNLPEKFIIQKKIIENESYIYLSLPQTPHECPNCKTITSRIHDYREQTVTDIPFLMEKPIIIFRKRRYYCPCCKKRFYENNSMLSRYKRQTNRFRLHVLGSFCDMKTITQIGRDHHVSSGIVSRIMEQMRYPKPAFLPRTIAIDEFRGNVGEKFQCLLVDPQHHTVLDVLPTRNSEDLHAYFNQYPMKMRKKVRYIIMDLSSQFYSMMRSCFPKAKIIADKFHVVRLITWALDKVRKKVQKNFAKNRRISFKRSKALLLKHSAELTEEEMDRVAIMLSVSDELRLAYRLKELFNDVMASKTRRHFKARYMWFKHEAEEYEIEEVMKHIATFDKWIKEIERSCVIGVTNGFIEGCNNRTKVLKHISYGFRNFNRFRNRLLCIANNTEIQKRRRHKLTS